jgi:hypothetical protein
VHFGVHERVAVVGPVWTKETEGCSFPTHTGTGPKDLDGVGVEVGVRDWDGVWDGVGEFEGVPVGVKDGVGMLACVDEAVGDAVEVAEAEAVAVAEEEAVAVAVEVEVAMEAGTRVHFSSKYVVTSTAVASETSPSKRRNSARFENRRRGFVGPEKN